MWRKSLAPGLFWFRLIAKGAGGDDIAGIDACPCIDPYVEISLTRLAELMYVEISDGSSCLKGPPTPGGERVCYPAKYGAGMCRAWDQHLPPHCADSAGQPEVDRPSWCLATWCYVDASACTLKPHPSAFFPNSSMYYSYEACGSIDVFSADMLLADTVSGKTFNVGVPGVWAPWLMVKKGKYIGITADFINELRQTAGFKINLLNISVEARAIHPNSSFDACTLDVGLHRLHFCYNAFWGTDTRRAVTAFSPQFEGDNLYLIVFTMDGAGLVESMLKVFQPFSSDLWLRIFLTCWAVGISLWIVNESDEETSSISTECRSMPLCMFGYLKAVIMASIRNCKDAMLTFLGQGALAASSISAKIIMCTFAFLCMVGVASYTANLSSFLLMSNLATNLNTVEEAIQNKIIICVPTPLVSMMERKFPDGDGLWLPSDSNSEMARNMDAGLCSGMLLNDIDFASMRAGNPPFKAAHCNKTKVGEMVLSIPLVIPMRNDLIHPFGHLWSKAVFDGKYSNIRMQYPNSPNDCPAVGGLKAAAEPLTPADLSSALLLAYFGIALGLANHIAIKVKARFLTTPLERLSRLSITADGVFRTWSGESRASSAGAHAENSNTDTPPVGEGGRSVRISATEETVGRHAIARLDSRRLDRLEERFNMNKDELDVRFGIVEKKMDVQFGMVGKQMDLRLGTVERKLESLIHSVDKLTLHLPSTKHNHVEEKRTLLISVLSATGLRNADGPWGLSDPYCTIGLENGSAPLAKTKVKNNTLNPQWNEDFILEDYLVGQTIVFKVWDKDLFTSDDYLGTATVTSNLFLKPGGSDVLDVKLTEAGDGVDATLHVKIIPQDMEASRPAFESASRANCALLGPASAPNLAPIQQANENIGADLQGLHMTALKKIARVEGVTDEQIEEAKDEDDPVHAMKNCIINARRGKAQRMCGIWDAAQECTRREFTFRDPLQPAKVVTPRPTMPADVVTGHNCENKKTECERSS